MSAPAEIVRWRADPARSTLRFSPRDFHTPEVFMPRTRAALASAAARLLAALVLTIAAGPSIAAAAGEPPQVA